MLHSVFPEQRHLPDRPLPRQGGDPEHPLLPVRQLVPRADLEPQLRAPGADHDGRGLRRAGPRQVLRGGRRAPRRHRRTTCSRRSACSRWSRRSGPASRSCATPRSRCSARCETLKPDDLVRGQFEGYRDEDGVAPDSDVETFAAVRAAHRLVALGRRAVLHPRRQEPAGHVHRGAGRAAPSAAAVFAEYEQTAARHELLPLPAQPADRRSPLGVRVKAPGDGFMGENVELYLCNDHPGEESAYERLLGDAMRRRERCCSRAKTASRRRGGSSTTCSPTTTRRTRTRSTRGARRSRTASSTDPDGWHDPIGRPPARRA